MRRSPYTTVALAVFVAACSPQPESEESSYDPYRGADAAALDCVPNLDGKVDADELQPTLGVEAQYRVSPPGAMRRVELKGKETSDGRRWDWSATYEDDRSIGIAAEPLEDQWYADSFPNGAFVLPVDLSGNTEGVYRKTDDRMLLYGIASERESPPNGEKTLYVYDEPVALYRFPLREGKQWVTKGSFKNGVFKGLEPYSGTDTYEVNVRAVGTMKLPRFTFEQVLRIDTKLTVKSAGGSAARRQVSFVAECFGEVARATSKNGVTKKNFERAAEVRRLGVRR